MKLLWQPAQLDPGAWLETDSADWKRLEANPEGLEVGSGAGAYCNALLVQGILFQGADHYAVEHLLAGGLRVWEWWDDPGIWPAEEFRARVVEIGYLAPDPLVGGAWNTRQRETWYGRPGGSVETRFLRDGPWSTVSFRSWDRFFEDLPDLNVVHGKSLLPELLAAHHSKLERRGWREWTDGVDPKVIDPRTGRVSRNQARLGLRAPKTGTYTRYLSDDTGSVPGHALTLELTTIGAPTTAGSRTVASAAPTEAKTSQCGWNFGGPANSGTNPNGLYQCQLDATTNDDFSFGIKMINSVDGHFCIYNLSSGHIDTWEQTEGTHTGTGVKTCSRTLNPADGDAFDSFSVIMVADHPAGHGGGTDELILELKEADDLIEGPWPTPPTTVTLDRAVITFNAQSPTATPGALTVVLSNAVLTFVAKELSIPAGATVVLDAATISFVAQAIASAKIEHLDRPAITFVAQSPTAVPGPLTVALDAATLTVLAQSPLAVRGPITVGLDAATLSVVAQELAFTSPLFVVLQRPAITFVAQSPTATPGPLTVTLDAATLSFVAQEALAGQLVTLDAATLTLTPQGLGYQAGPVTKTLDRAFLTLSTKPISRTTGPITVGLDAATLSFVAQELAFTSPLVVDLDAATVTLSAQAATAVRGPIVVGLDAATLTLSSQAATALRGELVVGLDAATISFVAQPVGILGGGQVVTLDAARITFSVLPVFTEGVIESIVVLTALSGSTVSIVSTADNAPELRAGSSREATFTTEAD